MIEVAELQLALANQVIVSSEDAHHRTENDCVREQVSRDSSPYRADAGSKEECHVLPKLLRAAVNVDALARICHG